MLYAPIIIPTLCRYEHLVKTIEALKQNPLAKETDLYIALDYPLRESHEAGYKKITQYLDSGIDGFKSVTVYKRETNLGETKNLLLAYEDMKKSHDSFILIEDDILASANFLEYINKGLSMVRESDDLYGVCGYKYPVSYPDKGSFCKTKYYTAWGCATTFENMYAQRQTFDIKFISKLLRNPFFVVKALKTHPVAFESIFSRIFGGAEGFIPGDFKTCLYLIYNNLNVLSPQKTKVYNQGMDGSGVHSRKSDENFNSFIIDNDNTFEFTEEFGTDTVETKKEIVKLHKFKIGAGLIIKIIIYIIFGKKFCNFLSKSLRKIKRG